MIKELRKQKVKRPDQLFFLIIAFFLLVVSQTLSWGAERSYPNRPISMIVPFAPGGGSDLASKIITEKISIFLGQPFITIYKPGGGGSLGSSLGAKAKPDGYTVTNGGSSPIILTPIVKKVDYKLEDFIPVGIYGKTPYWLVVKADARWKTLKEFVEEEKKYPGKLRVSTYGKLTTADFLLELLNKHAKVKLTPVPYKSTGEALTAVLGGHADAAMASGAGGLLESGSIRILALAEEKRLEEFPDVPTFKEFGYPVVISGHYSLMFPKGTPKEIVDEVYHAQKMAFERYPKEITEKLRRVEIWAVFLNPEDTMKQFKKEHEFMFKIAEELGVVAK